MPKTHACLLKGVCDLVGAINNFPDNMVWTLMELYARMLRKHKGRTSKADTARVTGS